MQSYDVHAPILRYIYAHFVGIRHSCMKYSAEFCYNCEFKWSTCSCGSYEHQAGPLIVQKKSSVTVLFLLLLLLWSPVYPPMPSPMNIRKIIASVERVGEKIIRPDADCQECGSVWREGEV